MAEPFRITEPRPSDPAWVGGVPSAQLASLYHANAKFSRYAVAPMTSPYPRKMVEAPLRGTAPASARPVPSLVLPHDESLLSAALGTTIASRRSVRAFSGRALSLLELGTLLRFGAGVTRTEQDRAGTRFLRAAPSGGARYPIETYVVAKRVDSVPPGLYHLDVFAHALVTVRPGDEAVEEARAACLYPEFEEGSSLTVLMTAVVERSTAKYGERGYRLLLLESGHIAQNLCLAATAMGMGALPLAGHDEHEMEEVLGIDGMTETLVYSVLVGEPGP